MNRNDVCFFLSVVFLLVYGLWTFIYWAGPGDFCRFRKSRFGRWMFGKINPEEQEYPPYQHGDYCDDVGSRPVIKFGHMANLLLQEGRHENLVFTVFGTGRREVVGSGVRFDP